MTRTTRELAALLAIALGGCGPDVAAPTLTAVTPSEVCAADSAELTLSGSNFTPRIEHALLGSVVLAPRVLVAEAAADRVAWRSESLLAATFSFAALAPGRYDVAVVNPDGQTAALAGALLRKQAGTVAISDLTPAMFCAARDQVLMVNGHGFVAGAAVTVIDETDQLVLTPAATVTATSVVVTLPMGSLPPGDYRLRVRNAMGDACESTAEQPFTVAPPPVVKRATPEIICVNGDTMTLFGSGFQSGANVTLTDSANNMSMTATSVTVADDEHATVQLGPSTLRKNQPLDLTLTNPDGCASTIPSVTRLRPGAAACK